MTSLPPKVSPAPVGAIRGPRGRGGRAADEPTIQVSLRLPESWIAQLRQRALAATAHEEKMITPQEIMRRIIGTALKAGD